MASRWPTVCWPVDCATLEVPKHSLAGDEADELADALLHRLFCVLCNLCICRQRLFHDAADVGDGQEAVLHSNKQKPSVTVCCCAFLLACDSGCGRHMSTEGCSARSTCSRTLTRSSPPSSSPAMNPSCHRPQVGPQAAPCCLCTPNGLPDVSQDKALATVLTCSRSAGPLMLS